MDIAKLSTNWLAAGGAKVEMDEETLFCTFKLNADKFEHIDANDKGMLEFYGVHAYRLLKTADLSKEIIAELKNFDADTQKGGFFELVDSNWKENFDAAQYTVVEQESTDETCHFIVVMGDKTLECFALDYAFTYEWAEELALDEYPEGNFESFLSMFMPDTEHPTRQDFHEHVSMYAETEGDEALEDLKSEVKEIIRNNHQSIFLKLANENEQAIIGSKELKEMMNVIVKY